MAEQAFSLEKHLSAWQARQETVEVEGVVQEDGDWYVIAPDPHQPGLLYRVRKSDVAERRESRVAEAAGVKHQMHALRVKKGVPVARISIAQSDQLADLDPSSDTLRNAMPLRMLPSKSPNATIHRTVRELASQEWWFYGCDLPHGGSGQCNGRYWVTTDFSAWKQTYGPYHPFDAGVYEYYWQIELTGPQVVPRPPWDSYPCLYIDVVFNTGSGTVSRWVMTTRQFVAAQSGGVLLQQFTGRFSLGSSVNDLEIRTSVRLMSRASFNYLQVVKVG